MVNLMQKGTEKTLYRIGVLEFVDIFSLFCFNYFS